MSKQDQNFFNLVTVVIGALIGVAGLLIYLARATGGKQQLAWVREDPAYAAAVDERLKPVGSVVLPGDDPATDSPAAATTPAAPVAAKLTGAQVYNAACFACHGAGIGGAPKLGDAVAWKPRLAQGLSTLQKHALEGYRGQVGYMPPKGGRVDLSDEEIIGAVEFISGKGG